MRSSLNQQRRRLLKQLACLPLAQGLSMMSAGKSAYAMGCDSGKSLVCIFLAGGADSFNMIVPTNNRDYLTYRTTRGNVAIEEADLLEVSDAAQGAHGFNSLLPGLTNLYRQNRLAVVANTGTLIRPTTKADYTTLNELPEALFSHNTQQKLWQTGAGLVTGSDSFGWGGAIGDHSATCNNGTNIAPTFSIAGSNAWLSSINNNYISLNYGVERMLGYDLYSDWIPLARKRRIGPALESLIKQGQDARDATFLNEMSNSVARATNATAALETALRENPLRQMEYNRLNKLAQQLHMVARLIASREQLGMERQVFFVRMGGWDTHAEQNDNLPRLLGEMDDAITAFQATIDDINKSSQIFGSMPNYASTGNEQDAGDYKGNFAGRIIPDISVTQYAATLSRWMGMDDQSIMNALPDLANFSEHNLGFMQDA